MKNKHSKRHIGRALALALCLILLCLPLMGMSTMAEGSEAVSA